MLTVFRRERLSNSENEEHTSINLMDKLIEKTVELALKEGIVEIKNKIIQDSTHTNARFQHISPREELIKQAKELRKLVYKIDESMHDKMPKKKEATGVLEDQIQYTKELLKIVKKDCRFTTLPGINEQINMLEETMFENNWYEYVEFGTTNPLTILLQRDGFSREAATYIHRHKIDYVVESDSTGELKLKRSLLECGNTNVMAEAKSIQFNAPGLFI